MCFKSAFEKRIRACVSPGHEMAELDTRPLDLPKTGENCRTEGLEVRGSAGLGVIRVSLDPACTSTIMREKVLLNCVCPECTENERLEKADRIKRLLQRILVCG